MILAISASFALLFNFESVVGSFTSCIYGGVKYRDGALFPLNDTAIATEGPHQCVQCRCHRGLVACEIENCPLLDCDAPEKHPRFCCQRCPGKPKLNVDSSDLVFSQPDSGTFTRKQTADCYSNERHFKNGSVWQPVIGPFGMMACVQCRCQEGNVVCSRLRCNELPCSHPVREFGQCCPVCPNLEEDKKEEASCLAKASELFVFKTANVRNNPEKIEYAFVENNRETGKASIHTWDLRRKSSSNPLTVKLLSRKEFPRGAFRILGSITRKRFRKYSKREERLRNNCFLKCLQKIKALENSLGVQVPSSKSKCQEEEVDVSNI